jgi:hypothetical protein
MFRLNDKTYKLVRIGLVRAACPRELESTGDNINPIKAIVIDANTKRLGSVRNIGFTPAGVIVAGASLRKRMMEHGYVHAFAFVDREVSEIRCDDEISSNELMEKLRQAIQDRIMGPMANMYAPGQQQPYILEVYPFENYFIYSYKTDKYRQAYVLDPVAKIVRLLPGSQKVEEKFVNASVDRMPINQSGLRYQVAPVAGNNQTSTMGAPHSELVTQLIRNWKNVLEAVAMYLSAIRNGQHKPPMAVPAFAPVALSPQGKILQALMSKGIDPYDFAQWSAVEQSKETKTKDGLPAKSFAYIGDSGDPSTWHLKIQDATHVRNALARVNQVKGIPEGAKSAVLSKLHKLAKHHGIDVTEKPTSKQKKWMKKGKEKYAA